MNKDFMNAVLGESTNQIESSQELYESKKKLKKLKKKAKKKGGKKLKKKLKRLERKIIRLENAQRERCEASSHSLFSETLIKSTPLFIEFGTELMKGINQQKK